MATQIISNTKSYGVGFNSVGKHKISINSRKSPAYSTWHSMLQRCYEPEYCDRQPAYIGCTVAPEWHDFQVFAEWFYARYKKGLALDKDLLVEGNKIYSPNTCVLVSTALNNLFYGGDRPYVGICRRESGSYSAELGANGLRNKLGTFKTRSQALNVYKYAKASEIVRQALLPDTPKILFNSLTSRAASLLGIDIDHINEAVK